MDLPPVQVGPLQVNQHQVRLKDLHQAQVVLHQEGQHQVQVNPQLEVQVPAHLMSQAQLLANLHRTNQLAVQPSALLPVQVEHLQVNPHPAHLQDLHPAQALDQLAACRGLLQ